MFSVERSPIRFAHPSVPPTIGTSNVVARTTSHVRVRLRDGSILGERSYPPMTGGWAVVGVAAVGLIGHSVGFLVVRT